MKNKNKVMKFGNITIDEKIIFYKRKLVYAFTNLKPFLKGHVLLVPTRVEKNYSNLSETEVMELWISAKKYCRKFKKILSHRFYTNKYSGWKRCWAKC